MSIILRLPKDERVFWTGSTASCSRVSIRPEHKTMFSVKDNIHKFTLPGSLDVDCCASKIFGG